MALEKLLGKFPLARFMDETFLRLPFALAGGCEEHRALGSWEVIERIVSQAGVDYLIGSHSQRYDGPRPQSRADVEQLLASGFTLGIRHAEKHDEGLGALARDFAADFLAPVDVQLFCTPGGQAGFGWHYDAEDVFVLQTHGSKDWWLRKNTVNPWPLIETLPVDMQYEREIMPAMHCSLKAGDWLYIPAGYWHKTQADEESISLSVGLAMASAVDMFDALRPHLLQSLLWRQRLPVAGAASVLTDSELLARHRELTAELIKDLQNLFSSEQFLNQFHSARSGMK